MYEGVSATVHSGMVAPVTSVCHKKKWQKNGQEHLTHENGLKHKHLSDITSYPWSTIKKIKKNKIRNNT